MKKHEIGSERIPACTGEDCPLKDNCMRYLPIKNVPDIYYLNNPPFKINPERREPSCEFIIEKASDEGYA